MVFLSEQEFRVKYDLYAQMLMNISFGYTKNKLDSEDIIQNVFIKYLNVKKDFISLEEEKYWLIRVCINECKNYLKSSYHHKVVLSEDIVRNYGTDYFDDYDIVFESIKNLPQKYKKVIVLYYFNSFTVKEISMILDIKESTIKKQLERGREKLKDMMEGVYEIR